MAEEGAVERWRITCTSKGREVMVGRSATMGFGKRVGGV